jgi:hypothetical protein
MEQQHTPQTCGNGGFWRSPAGLGLIAFLAIATLYLVTQHTTHVLGFLPYGLLLLCPIMHLLMHGGHGGHAGHEDHSTHANHSESQTQRSEGEQR